MGSYRLRLCTCPVYPAILFTLFSHYAMAQNSGEDLATFKYTPIVLEGLDGSIAGSAYPYGLNDRGDLVGVDRLTGDSVIWPSYSPTPNILNHDTSWFFENFPDISSGDIGPITISNRGEIVYSAYEFGTGLVDKKGKFFPLVDPKTKTIENLPPFAIPVEFSQSGKLVATQYVDGGYDSLLVRSKNGKIKSFRPSYLAEQFFIPWDMNKKGDIVADRLLAGSNSENEIFVFSAKRPKKEPRFLRYPEGVESCSYPSLNDKGRIAAQCTDYDTRPFGYSVVIWENTNSDPKTLLTLAQPAQFDNGLYLGKDGEIVTHIQPVPNEYVYFPVLVTSSGTMIPLEQLLSTQLSGWRLHSVQAQNNKGDLLVHAINTNPSNTTSDGYILLKR